MLKKVLLLTVMGVAFSAGAASGGTVGPRDPYMDGGKAARYDVYTDGARVTGSRDVFTDGARAPERRDPFTDGANAATVPRDPFADGSNHASMNTGGIVEASPELLAVARPKDCDPHCGGERQVAGAELT